MEVEVDNEKLYRNDETCPICGKPIQGHVMVSNDDGIYGGDMKDLHCPKCKSSVRIRDVGQWTYKKICTSCDWSESWTSYDQMESEMKERKYKEGC